MRDEPAPRADTADAIDASGAARSVSLRSGGEESDDGEDEELHVTRIPFDGGAVVEPVTLVAVTTQVIRCVWSPATVV
jgi:hypothetical protein